MSDENGNVENHTLAVLREIRGRLDGIDGRLDGIDSRLDRIEARLERVEARVERAEARLEHVEAVQAEHTQVLAGHSALLETLLKAVAVIDANQQKQTELLIAHSKKLAEHTELTRNHGSRLNSIEWRLGLIEGKMDVVPA